MSNGYRTLSQHLNDLKKENFSLKLRIYFLEERIQQKYEESCEDVYRTNIELKVEVESLKQELQEKQQHLDKALESAENLTNHNEAELQRRCQERQQEINDMQEVLETKIQLLQEEAQLARSEAERMASLAGSQYLSSPLSADTPMEDSPEDQRPTGTIPQSNINKDTLIEQLMSELRSKEGLMAELTGERTVLTERVEELEGQVEELSSSLLQKDKDVEFYQEELGQERLRIEQEMQSLVEEQQSQLNQYECAAGQCVSELQKAQLQVHSLQAKMQEGEANNTKLQEKLNEMECELRSIRQAAQFQERTIQGLTDSIDTKDGEAQDLYQLIEGQNASLCKLREMTHRNQLTQAEAPEGPGMVQAMSHLQGELVRAQSSLFSLGLELEASQRSLRLSQRQGEDLARFKERLHSDLQVALQHREVTEKHNQDLHSDLQRTRAELREKEATLKEVEVVRQAEALERERSLNALQHSLQAKDRQLQEYSEMLESPEPSKPRDALLEKLRERIKERDRALERSIDEKFRCLEEREGQVSRLQLALREKERDLERLRCILSNNDETITSLDSLVRGKDLELEQASEAYRSLQWLQQQSQEKEGKALREKDTAISQLQAALQTRSQEAQELRASLLARVQAGPVEVVEDLKSRLALKDQLFQELLSDRSLQSHQHQAQLQDLLNTVGSKDQYLQDCSDRLSQVIGERTSQLQELRKQLSTRDRELCELRRERERELGGETERLQSLLKEKEAFIKELMQGQEEAMESSSKEGEEEMGAVQEELQLVLQRENEAQREISALQEALAEAQQQAHEAIEGTDHHHILQQLQSEYYDLNDALRTEKALYQSLSHKHSRGDSSSEKTEALHTELDSVQALRGQLEEVLARTRGMALALERAAEARSDFGELSTEEEEGDEEGSSDEFSDSIEEDDVKVTAKSLGSAQGAPTAAALHPGGPSPLETGAHSQQVQRLEEAKKTLEGELQVIHSQLEKDGYSSLAQMRSTLLGLQQEIQALKGSRGAAGAGDPAGSPCWSAGGYDEREEEEEEEELEEQGKGSVRHLVQDLRAQLTRCHKVIRGLQMRVRSLSTTSDYASSLERTPRKQVNWAFEASPAHDGGEDDEGWGSDTLAPRPRPRPSRELRELVSRVASLEAKLKSSRLEAKGQGEEGKGATWPGKYNTLIQAQARELSHLRQRMREGRGVCHILTQHLGDTTKAFEELLRANDIDYYMGQSYREQLAQSTSLAQRVATKISGRDRAEGHDDKTGHELLALRLSKELQQKDQIIESLHTKLLRRAETPSSCHALSETSDQTDRTSLVSDECRTNEDLELCSELDASEYQDQLRQEPALGPHRGVGPSLPSPRGLKSCSSCPNMLSSPPLGAASQPARALPTNPVSCSLPSPYGPDLWGQRVTFDPRPRAVSVNAVRQELDIMYRQMYGQPQGFRASLSPLPPLGALDRHPLAYSPLSHHAYQPYPLGRLPQSHSLKSDSGLLTGGALWDMENVAPPMQAGYAGASAYHADGSHAGADLMEEHLREVRCLRQRLEESIRTNERLRQQLEERLASPGREGGASTNIYIQGLDSVTQLSNEIRTVKEENLALQSRLQASSDACEEAARLREAVLAGHARLKQAEHEAEQWKEELRRLQSHSQEQGVQIHSLRQERQAALENSNRLQHEASLLQQQLCESRELMHSLQSELHVYDRVCGSTRAGQGFLSGGPALPLELGELLGEVRSLRAQLQSSVQESSALKQLELHKQLEQKLGLGSPRTPSLSTLTASPQRDSFYRRQLLHAPLPLLEEPFDPHSELEGDAPDGSFANRNGRHAIGHVDDFSALQQQVLEGRSLVQRMETALQACLSQPPLPGNQEPSHELALDFGCIKSLLSNTKTLRQIHEEALSLLKMFWRAALPGNDRSPLGLKKEQAMQEEILSLRLRMSEQEEVLQGTIQRLRSTNRTKEHMELYIVNQLSRTRDVIKKARTNLEKNEQRLSSLSPASSTPSAAADPRPAGRERRHDWSFLKTGVAVATTNQRPVARKRSSQCLLETLTY
ncbi:unnamed protein product [Gadus morhua 'NCC']